MEEEAQTCTTSTMCVSHIGEELRMGVNADEEATLHLKIILIIVMAVLTLLFGLIPLPLLQYLRKKYNAREAAKEGGECGERIEFERAKWPSLILCLLSCFSGGVLLSICFLHLIPAVLGQLEAVKTKTDWDLEYPLAELVICAGFFLVFFAEELVLFCYGAEKKSRDDLPNSTPKPGLVHIHNHKQLREMNSESAESKIKSEKRLDDNGLDGTELMEEANGGKMKVEMGRSHPSNKKAKHENGTSQAESNGEILELCVDRDCLTNKARNEPGCSHVHRKVQYTSNGISTKKSPLHEATSRQHATECSVFKSADLAEPERCEGPCELDEEPPIVMASRPHAHSHAIRSLTLLLALSFHSIITGLAFGVEETKAGITAMFTGIIIHKVIVAFAVGVQFARTHAHALKLVLLSMFFFAIATPAGAAVGIGVSEATMPSSSKDLVLMIFLGIAAGTFIYVTFFEILIHERDNEHPNLLKLLFLVLGFGLIAALSAIDTTRSSGSSGTTLSAANSTAAYF